MKLCVQNRHQLGLLHNSQLLLKLCQQLSNLLLKFQHQSSFQIEVEEWRSGAMAQWRSGTMAQWHNGAVAPDGGNTALFNNRNPPVGSVTPLFRKKENSGAVNSSGPKMEESPVGRNYNCHCSTRYQHCYHPEGLGSVKSLSKRDLRGFIRIQYNLMPDQVDIVTVSPTERKMTPQKDFACQDDHNNAEPYPVLSSSFRRCGL